MAATAGEHVLLWPLLSFLTHFSTFVLFGSDTFFYFCPFWFSHIFLLLSFLVLTHFSTFVLGPDTSQCPSHVCPFLNTFSYGHPSCVHTPSNVSPVAELVILYLEEVSGHLVLFGGSSKNFSQAGR